MNSFRPFFLACVTCLFLSMAEMGLSDGVQHIKTSYKQYALFTFKAEMFYVRLMWSRKRLAV